MTVFFLTFAYSLFCFSKNKFPDYLIKYMAVFLKNIVFSRFFLTSNEILLYYFKNKDISYVNKKNVVFLKHI